MRLIPVLSARERSYGERHPNTQLGKWAKEQFVWRCQGCGENVDPDHGDDERGRGHTRSEHDSFIDPRDGSHNCRNCPIPVACGPVVREAVTA